MPINTKSKYSQDFNDLAKEDALNSEGSFFRVIALYGMIILPLLAFVYNFIRNGENFVFYPMLFLGGLCAIAYWCSYRYEHFIAKYNQELLFLFIAGFSFLQVYNCYQLDFPTLDTVTSITNIFILGAILNRRSYMVAYMVTSVLIFLLAVWVHPEPTTDRVQIFINTTLVALLAFVIYYNKIQFQSILKNNKNLLLESESRFKTVFKNAPMGITVINRKGEIVDFNEAVLNILGYEATEYLEKDPVEYVHPDDYETIDNLYKRVSASDGRILKEERRYFKKDGTQIWTNVMFALNENHQEIIITNEDISARVKAEAARKVYNDQLKQSNESLEHFSYVISHDLQEPLRMITMYTQRIKKKYLSQIKDEDADVDMGFVIGGAKRMSQLIKDLLEYSRLSSVEKEILNIDIEDLLTFVKNDLSVSMNESKAQIKYVGINEPIRTNQILLKQVFLNLISNSIKYRHPERIPLITIDYIKNDFDSLITYKDNGIGFETQYNHRIFLLFQRLHQRDEYTGTGIGLAICQKSVQQMGGKIWAEGTPGSGATFYIKIPFETGLIEG